MSQSLQSKPAKQFNKSIFKNHIIPHALLQILSPNYFFRWLRHQPSPVPFCHAQMNIFNMHRMRAHSPLTFFQMNIKQRAVLFQINTNIFAKSFFFFSEISAHLSFQQRTAAIHQRKKNTETMQPTLKNRQLTDAWAAILTFLWAKDVHS